MKKNRPSKSAFFIPRVLLAVGLCSIGAMLAMLSFAQPPAQTGPRASAQTPREFKPRIIHSFSNGVSPQVRDLPVVARTEVPTTWKAKPIRQLHPAPPMPQLPVHDPVQQKAQGPLAMPAPIQTFEGINQAGGCGNCIPPDTVGDVGPNHYVQMVNSSYAVYNKTGTKLAGPVNINSLWSNLPGECQQNNSGDPIVVYDHLADRWVISQFAVQGPYDECVAVSTTPDPAGAYYVYDFRLSNDVFHDYPKLGVWPDAYYMTTNEFPPSAVFAEGFGAFAMEREKMLLGLPARLVFFDLGVINTSFTGALPSDLDGPPPPLGSPNYFMEVDSKVNIPPNDAMRIWKFHVDWSNPANSTFGNNGQPNSVIPVTDFTLSGCVAGLGACVPQLGSPYQLDVLGDRIMHRLVYRNFGDHEALVANHSVVADARIGIRWYEVRSPGSSPAIFQSGTFAPVDDLYRWMGSIAMDRMGNIAAGYSTSGPADFPSIAYAGRVVADPPGQFGQGETQMFAGTGAENIAFYAPPRGRWGDYSALTVDPTDDCTFWYTTEYFGAEGTTDPGAPWRTRVGSFKFANCVPSATLQAVVSRKTHGAAGAFEVPLPLAGSPGIECRTGGAGGNHDVVFKFSAPVSFSVTTATCFGNPATTNISGSDVTVHCTNVPNAQLISVALDTTTGNFSALMGVLLGDTTANQSVNSSDIGQTKSRSGQNASSSNFRSDVTISGSINSSDIGLVKSKSGSSITPTP